MKALPFARQHERGGPQSTEVIFISWTADNGRTRDLASTLGVKAEFIPGDRRHGAVRRYVAQMRATLSLLRRSKPHCVIVMLPPTPLLVITTVWSKATGKRLVADLHTGFFYDPKWQPFARFGLRMLRGGWGIVTNQHLAERLTESSVRALIAHDPLVDRSLGRDVPGKGYVLCPISYANDEPIEAIMEAARQTPSTEWRLTGRAPNDVSAMAPSNVTFTGYVSDPELDQLFRGASVVAALTTRDHTMQRAGYEALMYGVPQVTSDFKALREFVGSAGLYVDPTNSHELAAAVSEILSSQVQWCDEARKVLWARLTDQDENLQEISTVVHLLTGEA